MIPGILLGLLTAVTVQVKVVNGTRPQAPIPDGYARLHVLSPHGNLMYTDSTRTRKGVATFKVEKEHLFGVASFTYAGQTFYSEQVPLQGDRLTLEITVYEPSDDPEALSYGRFHMVLIPLGKDTLYVNEIQTIHNASEYMYAGDAPALMIPLEPGGGTGFQPLLPSQEEFWLVVNDTVYFTGRVPPGDQTVAFALKLPFQGKKHLVQVLPDTLDQVDVFVSPLLEVHQSNLQSQGEQTLGQSVFHHYSGQNLDRVEITVTLAGAAGATGPRWILILGGLIVLVLLILVVLRARRGEA